MKNLMKFTLTLFAVAAINVCIAQDQPKPTKPGNTSEKPTTVTPANEKNGGNFHIQPANKVVVSEQEQPVNKSGAKKPADKDKVVAPAPKSGISNKIAVSDQGVPDKNKKPAVKNKTTTPQKTENEKKGISPK